MAKVKEKKFEIRELTDDDLFNVMEIASECSEELKSLLTGLDTKDVKAQGFKFITAILGAVTGKNKDKIRGFLASLIGKDLEDYKKMPLGTTLELVMELKENEDIKKFIATLSSMITIPENSTETSI